MPDGAGAFDAEWRWLYLNPVAANALRKIGKDPDHVLGRVLWEVLPEIVGTPFHDAMLRAARERQFVEHLGCYEPTAMWLEHRVVPLPVGVVTFVRNVSERVRAQEARSRLAAIVEASDDAIVSKDFDGIIRSWNAGATRLFGWSALEAIGQSIDIIIPPGHEDEEQRILERLRGGKRIHHYETTRQHRDGSLVHVSLSISPIVDQTGRPVGAAKIARDISQRRRAEDALREETRVLATLQRIGSTVTAELDLPRLSRLVAEEATALVCGTLGAFFYRAPWTPEDQLLLAVAGASQLPASGVRLPRDIALLASVVSSGESIRIDDLQTPIALSLLAEGLPPAVAGASARSLLAVPIVSPSGTASGTVCLVHVLPAQFSERHERIAQGIASWAAVALDNARLYEAERQARAEAQIANRAKGDFLATMSHELRTPLNAIAGYTELLTIGVRGPLNESQHEYLTRIQRAQHELLSLINDVLNFAKIEGGHVHFAARDVTAREMLSGIDALFAPQLRARDIAYEWAAGDEDAVVHADPDKVRQVLLNLMSNAVKFTNPGGRIVARVAQQEGEVWISVTDTGVGVPADKLEHIFEPFVQLDRELTSGHDGTGLGLAISRDLARAMGGDITVGSTVGRGSTFTLVLPRVGL
jgi:PAS domain S-box-containing protein